MIRVNVTVDNQNRFLKLRVSGHAGAAAVGHDAICAGATTLAYSWAQMQRMLSSAGDIEGEESAVLDEGRAEIKARFTPKAYRHALSSFETIMAGYQLLNANYPEYVKYNQKFIQASNAEASSVSAS